MFIFLRLLLAHFLADFPLQFDFIFKLKLRGFKGIIPHALIVFACLVLLCWPYLDRPMLWGFIIFVAAAHLIQDSIKLNLGVKNAFWTYLGDQLLHIATIALVLLTPLKDLQPPAPAGTLAEIYANDTLALYLIMLLAGTYNGYFLIRCFKDTFFGHPGKYTPFEKWYGIAERALVISIFFARIPPVILLPLALLRPFVYWLLRERADLHGDFISLPEVILSWTVALAAGAGLCLFQACHPVN